MAVTASQLVVKVSAEGVQETKDSLRGVSEESDHASGGIGGLLSTMGGFVGGAAIVNLAGSAFGFLKDQLVDSVKEGMGANDVLAAINAHLKSTHDVSGLTSQGIQDMAEHLSNMTGITSSAVEQSDQMLLTFDNIGKSTFPQAQQAVADLATTMNGGAVPSAQQMQQAALQLGKALNDPAKGLTALQRVGISFTDQQKAQITAMEKAGNTAGAQKIILQELNREMGGSAAAAGQANGGLAILAAQGENLKEKLGQALIPILTQLLGAVTPVAEAILSDLTPAISQIGPLFNSLTSAAKGLPLQQTAQMFRLLAAVAEQVGQRIGQAALPVLKQLGDFFAQHLLPAFNQLVGFVAGTVLPMFGEIATFLLQTVVPALLQFASFWTDVVLPANEQLVAWFRANLLPVLEQLVKVIVTDVLPVLEGLAKTIMEKVVPPIERIVGYILPVLIPAFQAIGWVITTIVGPVLNLLLNILGFLLDKLADLVGVIATHVGPAFNAIGTWVHNVLTLFSNLSQAFNKAGHDLVQGLIDGIKHMLGAAVKAATDVGQGILGGIKGLFGIHSPSSVFAEIGANLSRGLINGVKSLDVAGAVNAHMANVTQGVSATLGLNVAGGSVAGLSGLGSLNGVAPSAASGLIAPSPTALLTQQLAGAAGAATGSGQPVLLVINDGGMRVLARGLLPYTTSEIRRATGIRTM